MNFCTFWCPSERACFTEEKLITWLAEGLMKKKKKGKEKAMVELGNEPRNVDFELHETSCTTVARSVLLLGFQPQL